MSTAVARLDRRGYERSVVTLPEFRRGKKPANAGRKFPVETLTRGEVLAILGECGRGYAGLRDRAGIVLMYRAGLRIEELLALMPKDIDLARGMVTVLHGKGDKRRTIPVDRGALDVVELWLERRRELGLTARHPFFCTISRPNRGDPYWDSVVRKKVKVAAARAGVHKRVSPHVFRHTYATELAEEGVPVHVVRVLLGHNSLETTERYIRKLHPADLARYVHARQWDPLALPRPSDVATGARPEPLGVTQLAPELLDLLSLSAGRERAQAFVTALEQLVAPAVRLSAQRDRERPQRPRLLTEPAGLA